MSGPSKFLVNLIVKLSKATIKISPLHNRFKIDDSGVAEEIAELEILRREKDKKMLMPTRGEIVPSTKKQLSVKKDVTPTGIQSTEAQPTFDYRARLKDLMGRVKTAMDAKDYNEAMVFLKEMILIAEKNNETALAENYKTKFAELLKKPTEN
jgi:hypothetical protein